MAIKESAFRFRVEEELHQAFLAACRAEDLPAAQVLHQFMRRYIQEQEEQAPQQGLFRTEAANR